ncbi:hypothetical protein FA13DRAFT_1716905 [Coprinellus micaceus]|uniref:Uncharacterized protein n=1 Tax=Coprinellus micaceus TaxID=71717 RepID=A0A4Y7SI57_COPMI|nr:hypothetical protein FA13DRAFT_1716905 [Coprinellus micaceus]
MRGPGHLQLHSFPTSWVGDTWARPNEVLIESADSRACRGAIKGVECENKCSTLCFELVESWDDEKRVAEIRVSERRGSASAIAVGGWTRLSAGHGNWENPIRSRAVRFHGSVVAISGGAAGADDPSIRGVGPPSIHLNSEASQTLNTCDFALDVYSSHRLNGEVLLRTNPCQRSGLEAARWSRSIVISVPDTSYAEENSLSVSWFNVSEPVGTCKARSYRLLSRRARQDGRGARGPTKSAQKAILHPMIQWTRNKCGMVDYLGNAPIKSARVQLELAELPPKYGHLDLTRLEVTRTCGSTSAHCGEW